MALLPFVLVVTCAAAPVSNGKVHAGPFTGRLLFPRYDVVRGRFRMHPAGYRDRRRGISDKIPWFVSTRARPRSSLLVTGRRLDRRARRFSQSFARANPERPARGRYVFPSNIVIPSAGCWQLTLRSGRARGTLRVVVSG